MRSHVPLVAVTCAAASLSAAHGTRAAEPQRTCPDVLLISSHPAMAEWATWVSGGRLMSDDAPAGTGGAAAWLFGAGAEATFQAFTYRGFPGLTDWDYPDGELRWGPWLAAGYRHPGAWGEAGLKMHLGAVRSQAFGTFELRSGLGYGQMAAGLVPFSSSSVGWGVRTVLGRRHARGACDPGPVPRATAEASSFRVLLTHRHSWVGTRGTEWLLSLELSPTFFLPPVVCEHFSVI